MIPEHSGLSRLAHEEFLKPPGGSSAASFVSRLAAGAFFFMLRILRRGCPSSGFEARIALVAQGLPGGPLADPHTFMLLQQKRVKFYP
jgi:hypothetical protein